ncbi:MAG: hypothetical protein JWL59_2641 [Chthoniobacteraceae bacterium]|nr:hypothetical protein [Chthoniobacteraceae bacterium]
MLLLENNKVRDCFTLARCIFETTINACFIAGNGQTTESQAVKHAVQKAHREKQRRFTFRHTPLNVGWPHGPVPPNHPMVVAALAEYTSKKGREITSWTQEAIEERIEAIEKWLGPEIGDRLRFAMFSIYRDSSEIIHGTLYSVLSFAGTWNIPAQSRSKLTMEGYHRALATTLSLQVAGCLNTAIRAACRLSGDDNNASVANDVLRAVKEAPWAKGLKISPDGYPMRDPLKNPTGI